MSCFIRIAEQDVWNPSNGVAKLFIAQAEAIASLLDERTGIGPIIDDECELDDVAFPVFVGILLRRHWSTNHPVLRNLLVGVAGAAFVLVSRADIDVQIDDLDCRDYWLAQLPHISRGMVRG